MPKNVSELNVLVFDSNADRAAITKQTLRQAGIRRIVVETAPQEPSPELDHSKFDLVISDMGDDPKGGLEVIRVFRANCLESRAEIPLLALLDKPDKSILFKTIRAGADNVVLKPFAPATIKNKIEQLLAASITYVEAENYFGPDPARLPG